MNALPRLNSDTRELVDRLKRLPGIVGIVLGGSRARGTGHSLSDTDLGLYYDGKAPFDTGALDEAVARHDDRKHFGLVTSIGDWGPWINGGGWLRMGGEPVDLLYRDMVKVEAIIDAALTGQVEVAYQPGHPLGFLSSIYAGEIAVCQPLWDPAEKIAEQKSRLASYPEPLRQEFVRRFKFEARFSLDIAEKAALRPDITYVAGCLFRSVGWLLIGLFALNRAYWLNEKGALAIANQFEVAPPDLEKRVGEIWRVFNSGANELSHGLRMARSLVEEVIVLAESAGLA
ncbi:MAG: nucleotidyltransferase domain-containing protein [Verrucomicrobia bacterium]|nr:nucleotidyltransferase domain-containing protein [Verrucomicrobiota bacterium]